MSKPSIVALLESYGFENVPAWGGWHAVRCAFHGDRHASASVNSDEEVFRCHVCEIGGDAYAVVMQREGVDFSEAVRRVQSLTGFANDEVPGRAKPVRSKLSERQRSRGRGNRALSSRRGGRS